MKIVQHIAFNCIDKAAQEGFYTKHFGFRRARVFSAGTPDEFVMLRLGGACIELFSSPADGPVPIKGEAAVGFKHLAFEVEDIDEKIRGLAAEGLEPGEIIDCSDIVEGMRVCFLDDPEGNILEIMQGWQDDPDV